MNWLLRENLLDASISQLTWSQKQQGNNSEEYTDEEKENGKEIAERTTTTEEPKPKDTG